MKHLKENNETYFSHLKFALSIGTSLMIRGALLILHAFLPMVTIPKKWSLDDTLRTVYRWSVYANKRKKGTLNE